jgi:hypothetical protein
MNGILLSLGEDSETIHMLFEVLELKEYSIMGSLTGVFRLSPFPAEPPFATEGAWGKEIPIV